jgi:carbonic anhydrase
MSLFSYNSELNVARLDPDWEDVLAAYAALKAGNALFQKGVTSFPDLGEQRRRDLADDTDYAHEKASPFAAVLSCSDHRVAPELVFTQGLGRLFVMREAGNRLGDQAEGSLEYAVDYLKVPLVVILGHLGCAAVRYAVARFQDIPLDVPAPPTKLEALLEDFRIAFDGLRDNTGDPEIVANALNDASVDQVFQTIIAKPSVRTRIANKNLAVIRANYHLETGAVRFRDTVS